MQREVEKIKEENRIRRQRGDPYYILGNDLCNRNGTLKFARAYGEVIWYSAKEIANVYMFDAEALARVRVNSHMAPEVKIMLENDNFQASLQDCGNAISVLNGMFVADVAGKTIAVIGVPYMMRYFYRQSGLIFAPGSPMALRATVAINAGIMTYVSYKVQGITNVFINRQNYVDDAEQKVKAALETTERRVTQFDQQGDVVFQNEIRRIQSMLAEPNITAEHKDVLDAELKRFQGIVLLREARKQERIQLTTQMTVGLGEAMAITAAPEAQK